MKPPFRRRDDRPRLRLLLAASTSRLRLGTLAGIAGLLLMSARPAGSIEITEAVLTPDGLQLRWSATIGKSYAVQAGPSIQGPWTSIHEQLAEGTSLTWTDPAPTTQHSLRLYRVAESDPSATESLARSLQLADAVPVRLGELFVSHLDTCASAIYLASTLRGGALTTNGTLSQSGIQWSYAAAPADALEIHFATGTNLTYRTRQIAGDLSANASTFLNSGHNFEFEAVQTGVQDLRFTSRRPAGNCNISPWGAVAGTLVVSNTVFTIDVQATGPYCFETDLSGYSLLQDYRTTGTVTAQGFRLTVDHRRRYEAVGSGPGDATAEQVWMAHQLTLGNDTYLWTDVKRQKSFRHGKVSQWEPPGYWSATGQIVKNGIPIATYTYLPAGPPSDIYLRFLLRVGAQTIELERWAAY
ncbi:MAG: hypothetical protein JNK85_00300 [Verrucomicrobiales bacterium]|nr:hypothetical protein [Verrucomicrobiales bacterium]